MNSCADVTPMFESSHTLADKDSIRERLQKFLIEDKKGLP